MKRLNCFGSRGYCWYHNGDDIQKKLPYGIAPTTLYLNIARSFMIICKI